MKTQILTTLFLCAFASVSLAAPPMESCRDGSCSLKQVVAVPLKVAAMPVKATKQVAVKSYSKVRNGLFKRLRCCR